MRKQLIAAMVGVIAFAACSNDTLSPGTATDVERAEILDLAADLPFLNDDFGEEGIPTTAAASFDGVAAAMVGPQNWGRRRGIPVRREVRIDVNEETGLATLESEIEFDGSFLVRDPATDQLVDKPLQEIRYQNATFQRLTQEEADEQTGKTHRWRLVGISPAEYAATNPDDRVVRLVSVTVLVNGVEAMTVTDPAELIRVEDRIARLELGSEVTIQAQVQNDTGSDPLNPEDTYLYLHLRHAAIDLLVWRRMPMEYDAQVGAYVASWVVRHRGRERIIVDALDAETVSPAVDAPYYSNMWSIPYRTVILRDPAE